MSKKKKVTSRKKKKRGLTQYILSLPFKGGKLKNSKLKNKTQALLQSQKPDLPKVHPNKILHEPVNVDETQDTPKIKVDKDDADGSVMPMRGQFVAAMGEPLPDHGFSDEQK